MNNLTTVVSKEYTQKVTSRSFILLSFLTPLLLALLVGVVVWVGANNTSEKQTIYVLDQSHFLSSSDFTSSETLEFIWDTGSTTMPPAEAYILEIPPYSAQDLNTWGENIVIHGSTVLPLAQISEIKGQISAALKQKKYSALGLEKEKVDLLKTSIAITFESSQNEVTRNDQYHTICSAIGLGMAFFIYMIVFIFCAQVMRSVLEEKTTRVIEVILSSVSPEVLLSGKIIASFLVAITQLTIWVLSFGVFTWIAIILFLEDPSTLVQTNTEVNPAHSSLLQEIASNIWGLPWGEIIGFGILFFILNFILYSVIFAAIGALSNAESDTQQYMLPVTIPNIIALYVGMNFPNNPDGSLAVFFSIFPLTSPICMAIRLPFGVPIEQILVSLGLLMVTIWFMIRVASKIYKRGVLNFSSVKGLQGVLKLLRD